MFKNSAFLLTYFLLTSCGGNFSDEMKITGKPEISKTDGARVNERSADHKNSPYFKYPDFYNMKSTDHLTILPKFKTIQQSSEFSCGPAAALMVMDYFGKLGENNEQSLAQMRPKERPIKNIPEATNLADMIKIFKTVGGFEMVTTYDYGFNTISEENQVEMLEHFIKSGYAVLVLWNASGPHWQVIIGYDNMGTEKIKNDDVLIFADSYDVNDHNQDGYTIYSAVRFVENWTIGRFGGPKPEDNEFQFIAVRPE
ncbi:MAG: C39 family peptidase [Alphaproteobacteria bacterium]|nr:C39 family peptidase [Alphaproteobacteria bacterium]